MNENIFAGRMVRNHKHPGNFKGPMKCGVKVTGRTMFAGRQVSKGWLSQQLAAAKAKINPRAATSDEMMRNLHA